MAWGSNRMHFTYDSLGPASVTYNGNRYFYLKNAQGDVTGLVNASGTMAATLGAAHKAFDTAKALHTAPL